MIVEVKATRRYQILVDRIDAPCQIPPAVRDRNRDRDRQPAREQLLPSGRRIPAYPSTVQYLLASVSFDQLDTQGNAISSLQVIANSNLQRNYKGGPL